ncbi:hypothetical protein HELRODRAFT_167434 [Helobdella robusta]|uniref:Uncharacterized protein n=1 Tax=Helobdella robusta TaxID=6412 RepID=T1EZD2_HELRO|nr:hypothetical protein HELRODRAFT_167434 [Helobdella robusta]ESO10918.1 hypothetical protein HELRODRAFT_167434 [Helobdella robusta]
MNLIRSSKLLQLAVMSAGSNKESDNSSNGSRNYNCNNIFNNSKIDDIRNNSLNNLNTSTLSINLPTTLTTATLKSAEAATATTTSATSSQKSLFDSISVISHVLPPPPYYSTLPTSTSTKSANFAQTSTKAATFATRSTTCATMSESFQSDQLTSKYRNTDDNRTTDSANNNINTTCFSDSSPSNNSCNIQKLHSLKNPREKISEKDSPMQLVSAIYSKGIFHLTAARYRYIGGRCRGNHGHHYSDCLSKHASSKKECFCRNARIRRTNASSDIKLFGSAEQPQQLLQQHCDINIRALANSTMTTTMASPSSTTNNNSIEMLYDT